MTSAHQKHRLSTPRTILRLFTVLLLLIGALCSCDGEMTNRPASLTRKPQTVADQPVMAPKPQKKRVALTFDDGPQYANGYGEYKKLGETVMLVDELSKYGAHATFFVVGNRIGNGDALAYAVQKGNEIGIHGFTHTQDAEHYYDTCEESVYRNELENTADAIRRAVPDYNVRLMRPVGGRISNERVMECPYAVIMWSVDSEDWQNTYSRNDTDEEAAEKVNTIVDNVMSTVMDGDIILMHDIYQSTFDATVVLLQRLYEAGFEVVTVSELLGENLTSGRQYSYRS